MAIDFEINGHRYTNDPALAAAENIPAQYQFIGYNAVLALESYAEDVVAVGGGSTEAAEAAAVLAEAFAASAILAPGSSGTSSTALTTAYGAQIYTVQPGKNFNKGAWVTLASDAAPDAVQMSGPLLSYDPATGAMIANIKALSGIGLTAADWVVSLSAPGGAQLGFNQYTGSQFYAAGIFEGLVDMAAGNNADLGAGTLFKKTATASWALTVSGIPAGASACFILELTNGGLYPFTPPAGTTYPGGVVPSLSAAGTDALALYRLAGGSWRLFMLGKDAK
ncbi:hypothetical protein [Duganella sp. OV510]|uniref:hypothetical protein n=1 Tax=Duganella sp. OV510 TaxID=1881039 RepID=UPI00088A398E|nr:hypothetical protein [Duganella sp. OV510]SDK76127.1 hypothetical protein SAMN05428973_1224 [Duganella sp. OV510]